MGVERPPRLAFAPPSPNPVRGPVTLRFALAREGHVSLAVYDLTGRRVRDLVVGARPAGEHAITWDLRDEGGRAVGAGLYIARLAADGHSLARRFVTLR